MEDPDRFWHIHDKRAKTIEYFATTNPESLKAIYSIVPDLTICSKFIPDVGIPHLPNRIFSNLYLNSIYINFHQLFPVSLWDGSTTFLSDIVGIFLSEDLRNPMNLKFFQLAWIICWHALSPKWCLPMNTPIKLSQLCLLSHITPIYLMQLSSWIDPKPYWCLLQISSFFWCPLDAYLELLGVLALRCHQCFSVLNRRLYTKRILTWIIAVRNFFIAFCDELVDLFSGIVDRPPLSLKKHS